MCQGTEVSEDRNDRNQFGPIYPTEIIAIVQSMYADLSFGMVGQVGWCVTFLMVVVEIPNRKAQIWG